MSIHDVIKVKRCCGEDFWQSLGKAQHDKAFGPVWDESRQQDIQWTYNNNYGY